MHGRRKACIQLIQSVTFRDSSDIGTAGGSTTLGTSPHPGFGHRSMIVLETPRLRLLPLDDEHLAGLHAINGDPAVMEFIGNGQPLSLLQSQIMITTVQQRWREHGMSWWALLRKEDDFMVGAMALQPLEARAGAVPEIGWRLRRDCWKQGYATEAGRVIMEHARATGHQRVVAVCHLANVASMAVMRRLDMHFLSVSTYYQLPCALFETRTK